MEEPELSPRFDVDDIRKLREYDSMRYMHMTSEEIIAETRKGAAKVLAMLEEQKERRGAIAESKGSAGI